MPLWGPFGECLDKTIRSGRCGDWVFQVLPGNKQVRHLYVRPQDPRTPRQLGCRSRLTAASRGYSASLTEEQRDACIADGANRRSRPRLGHSGPLTGQQYWVSRQCTGTSQPSLPGARKPTGPLQIKEISTPTSEVHRVNAVIAPGEYRGWSVLCVLSRRARKGERFRYHPKLEVVQRCFITDAGQNKLSALPGNPRHPVSMAQFARVVRKRCSGSETLQATVVPRRIPGGSLVVLRCPSLAYRSTTRDPPGILRGTTRERRCCRARQATYHRCIG